MTATAAPCTSCQGGEMRGLERTRFFPRQIVTPDDLTQDQIYFREKSKRHNRMLHGWGVVCGACVRRGGTPCEVIVEPGYVLGPFGDEIVIDRETVVDVCKLGTGEQDGCCGEELDPWCSDVRADCAAGTYYLAVKYSDCMSRPVRGGGGCGCGCDDLDCEYSRVRDSFSFKLLRELPAGYTTPMKQPPFSVVDPCLRPAAARVCPPCPTDPWVILADVMVDEKCNVRAVNCFTHRRYVMSFAEYYFVCVTTALGVGAGIGANIASPFMTGMTTNTGMMSMMSMMSGSSNLMDTEASASGATPRAIVALSREDGTTAMLPAFFTVERGSTVGDLLEREGDRTYFDPATERTYSLRELYRAAGVPASTRLESTAAALSPLEGKVLSATTAPAAATPAAAATTSTSSAPQPTEAGAARARERLRGTIDPSALAELRDEADVAALPATALAGVSEKSALGKKLAELTVGDVGAMTRDELVAHATKGVSTRQRKQVAKQAEEVWRHAQGATSAYAPEPEDMDE
ncbi:MAG: hypothetical protein JWL95_635 [Gemmatimonadetes bacterium]|nr:hypothetical protein [Gemmatimonadota bacterium]